MATLVGDWARASKVLNGAAARWNVWIDEVGSKITEEASTELKAKIYTQRLNLVALNPSYRAKKIRRGRDARILISSHAYIRSIRTAKLGNHKYAVTVEDQDHWEAGVPMWLLALWLEFGTRKKVGPMPPRPHWRPVYRNWRALLPKRLKIEVKTFVESLA